MPVVKENYDVVSSVQATQVVKQPWHAHGSDWKPFFLPSALKA